MSSVGEIRKLLLFAMYVGACVFHSEVVLGQVTGSGSGTVLRLPKDRAIGVVSSRPADVEGYGFGWGDDYYSGWRPIGPAQGHVPLPSGHHIRLSISNAASTDLSFLEQLDPAAIDALRLRGSSVVDEELKYIGRLTGLRFLQLGQTRISDRGIRELGNLHNLQYLDLSAFDVHRFGFGVGDEGLAVIARLPALERISLRLTNVTNFGLVHLVKCKSLRSISLEGTEVTDLGLKLLGKLPNLESLSLGVYDEGANVTDKGLPAIGELTGLRSLSLSGTPITDEGLAFLARLNELEHLSIDNTQVTNAGLRHLSEMASLRRLRAYSLGDGDITDLGAQHLSQISSLERIVARLRVTDKGVAAIAKLPRLQSVAFDGDGERITDDAIRSFAGHPSLKRLSLSECAITYAALSHLKSIPNLEDISISRRGLDARGLAYLKEIPTLRFARFHFGREADREPGMKLNLEPIRNLKQLRWLEISGESISGRQLEPISDLTQLEHLDVGDIVLDDESAELFSRLRSLTYFRARETEITDRGIPFLSGMKQLEYLTLSCRISDYGLRALRELDSLRMLQIASPHVTAAGLSDLSAALPALQEINHSK